MSRATRLKPRIGLSDVTGLFAPRRLAAPIATASGSTGAAPGKTPEYPTFKKLDRTWLPFASQSAPSMLWMTLVDMRGFPGATAPIYGFYSTDHGVDRTTAGIYLVTMDDPYGANLVDKGRVYGLPSGTPSQPETPSVWLDYSVTTVVGTTFALTASSDLVTKTAHGLTNGTPIKFSALTGAPGPVAGYTYYVINATANTFQFSITPNGAVYDITADGTATVSTTGSPLIRCLFQQNEGTTPSGEGQQLQDTRMIVSSTGLNGSWTDLGVCMAWTPNMPGDPTVDYVRFWRRGEQMWAYSLAGGGAWILWSSSRGGVPGSWTTDGRRILNNSDMIAHLDDYDYQSLMKLNSCGVIDHRGRDWWLGAIEPPAGGVAGGENPNNVSHLYAAPLTSDFRRPAAAPVRITPAKASWETDPSGRMGHFGQPFSWDGDLLIPYRTGTKTSDWGLMILDQGV